MNIFWVPLGARWAHLKAMAPQPTPERFVRMGGASRVSEDEPAFCGGGIGPTAARPSVRGRPSRWSTGPLKRTARGGATSCAFPRA